MVSETKFDLIFAFRDKKYLIMHGKDIILVYLLMVRQDRERVIQSSGMEKTKVSFQEHAKLSSSRLQERQRRQSSIPFKFQ